MPLIVSSISEGQIWLPDLGHCALTAGNRLAVEPAIVALLNAASVGHLFINVTVTKDLPHYFLVMRGRVRAGKDSHYIVSIHESACVGTDENGLVALITRACAVALFDAAKQCRFDEPVFHAWFAALAGKDRFECD
jgi:hypothetical protein